MTKTYEAYAEVFGQQELAPALYGLPAEYKAEIGITGFDISHIASLIADAAVAANIYSQMGFTGEYYTVDYKGKKYVIFKGFGSMRRALKGTIYLAKDPRVIKLGIGPFGARSALKFSAILTLVLYATDVVVQGLAGDFPTLGKLTNGLFQAGADFALSSVASAIIGAAIGIVTTAVFPAALGGIIAGAAVSYLFNSEVRERTVTRNFLKLLRSDSGGAASATYSCSDLGASAPGCTLLGSGADTILLMILMIPVLILTFRMLGTSRLMLTGL